MLKTLVTTALFATASVPAFATSLLTNGDFEAGNTGFSSGLLYVPGANTGAAQYNIFDNPRAWNGAFDIFGDHTTGSGDMMMVNGSTSSGDLVWSQTVAVDAMTTYTFSGWIADLFSGSSAIELVINGTNLGSIIAPSTRNMWEAFSRDWDSGSDTSATISLLQQTTAFGGNDYALDDLSFVSSAAPVPLPAAFWGLLVGIGALAGLRRKR